MNDDELASIRRALYQIARNHSLGWVVEEVEKTIDLGIPEDRSNKLREPASGTSKPTGIRRRQEFVGVRAMTPSEQVSAILDALKRVIVELPVVAGHTIRDVSGARSTPAESAMHVKFVSERDDVESRTEFDLNEAASPIDGSQIASVLDRLRSEVPQ